MKLHRLRNFAVNFMMCESIAWGQGLRIFLLFAVIAVSGCSIQRDRPDFTYPALRETSAQEWPRLKPSGQLARDNEAAIGNGQSPSAILASRIARLRARAAALSAYQF